MFFDLYVEPKVICAAARRWLEVNFDDQEKSVVTFYPNGYPIWSPVTSHYANTHNACMAVLSLPMPVSFSTIQMCVLMDPRIKRYDVIRIFNDEEDVIDIISNHDGTWECNRTQRVLRNIHSFYHLWANGAFDKVEEGEDA